MSETKNTVADAGISLEEMRRDQSDKNDGGSKDSKPIDLDHVLVNELGQFGWFQTYSILLLAFPIISSAFSSEYIFGAAAIPHRCKIPECEEWGGEDYITYAPEWILAAVPESNGGPASCQRYESMNGSTGFIDYCPASLFNQSSTIPCDGYVYADKNTVVYDFDLGCQEWLRALAGTMNHLGNLLALPLTGFISDKFGRRVAFIYSAFCLNFIGLLKAFSVNYTMYLTLQVLQTVFGGGVYSTSFIFAAELVGPKYRVVIGAITSSMFALGQVVLGSLAWAIQPWRYLIITMHVPCFLIIAYYWCFPESVRWLLAKEKYDEAIKVLQRVCRVNKKQISDKSIQGLTTPKTESEKQAENPDNSNLIVRVLKSPVLLRRVVTTPIWWVTTTFVYYGLTINSVGLSDNTYLNFILTCAIEVPGFFTSVLFLSRIGRKATLVLGYFLSSACNFAFAFINKDLVTLRLVLYMLGKFGISIVVPAVYLYTSELYPTEFRHSLFGFSSMIGRIGSITAPLTPVLMMYWEGVPSVLFGSMGLLAGVLVLTQPETLGTKLPDTLGQAEAIGTPQSKLINS